MALCQDASGQGRQGRAEGRAGQAGGRGRHGGQGRAGQSRAGRISAGQGRAAQRRAEGRASSSGKGIWEPVQPGAPDPLKYTLLASHFNATSRPFWLKCLFLLCCVLLLLC